MPRHLCPWCKSEVVPEAAECASCGRAVLADDGERLRDIDIPERWEHVVELQNREFRELLLWGTPIAALLCLISPFLTGPLHVVISAPFLAVAHGLTLYFRLIAPGQRILGKRRRFIARTTRRLFFYPLALLGYMSGGTPLVGAVVGAGTFAGLTALAAWHIRWAMQLERDHRSPTGAERLLFGLMFVLALLVLGAIGLLIWGVVALWTKLESLAFVL